MPRAEVIVRDAVYHCVGYDFELIPSLTFSHSRDAEGLLGALRLRDLNLKGLCASGGLKFLNVVVDGAAVNLDICPL